ncbi:MAG: hypothetical protein KDB27_20825, partial [Planctomycetales bacterium]|nr:hypothetical protein [Planctomycetales bacterium]
EIAAATVGIANAGNLPASYFCPVAEDVRYVELVIRENYGDTEFVGLSEIAFAGRLRTVTVPETTSLTAALVLTSALYLSRLRRKA